jgi:hypothetical protein
VNEPFEGPRRRWGGNIKMDFKEIACEDGEKIHLFVNTVIKSGLLIDRSKGTD